MTAGPFRHKGFCTGKKQQSRHAAALSFLDFYTNTGGAEQLVAIHAEDLGACGKGQSDW